LRHHVLLLAAKASRLFQSKRQLLLHRHSAILGDQETISISIPHMWKGHVKALETTMNHLQIATPIQNVGRTMSFSSVKMSESLKHASLREFCHTAGW
jgi:hypothetical protein